MKHTKNNALADIEAMDMLKDEPYESKGEWYEFDDIEEALGHFDDDLCDLFNKYIGRGFVSKDGYLFFEDEVLEGEFSLATDMLKELIKYVLENK
tara:strand:+ start:197 stop:481 length:285 start_codon:yes stop_codon:yes gene_type:complete